MINVKNLSVNFGEKVLFDEISLTVPKSKLSVIVGANGVGKTTLLELISKNATSKNLHIEVGTKNIFYLPQKLSYTNGITLFDYVSSVFFKQNWKWYLDLKEKEQIKTVLEQLEIYDKKDVLIENLSAGELQKANIGLGLISGAELLILDEPTSNMDLINQVKILDIIKKLTQSGITVLVVLHDLNLALKYGDNFVGISQNKTLQADKLNFFTQENLKKIYDIDFEITKNKEQLYVQISN